MVGAPVRLCWFEPAATVGVGYWMSSQMGGVMGDADGLHRRSFGLAAGCNGLRSATGLEMRAMAVEFPVVHGHPNRLPFEGVLTLVDVASDKAPSGARGHR